MIKIHITSKQKLKIEKIYWDWMEKYHLQKLICIIEEDEVLKEIVLDEAEDLNVAIKKFLLSDWDKLLRKKQLIDRLNGEGKYIKESSRIFLEKRYNNFRDSQAAKIVEVLKITVCPYCNQNHINVIYDKYGKVKFRGDLDHFYDKSTYRAMAICLYNLIPACKVCNQLKSHKKHILSNPYDYNTRCNIIFKTEFDDTMDLNYLNGRSQNFNIVINENSLSEVDKEEIGLFDLKERYSDLKRNAQEIIIKAKAYDEVYRKSLIKEFDFTDEELATYIFGYEENHLNRVLSKFNKDIMEQFVVREKK